MTDASVLAPAFLPLALSPSVHPVDRAVGPPGPPGRGAAAKAPRHFRLARKGVLEVREHLQGPRRREIRARHRCVPTRKGGDRGLPAPGRRGIDGRAAIQGVRRDNDPWGRPVAAGERGGARAAVGRGCPCSIELAGIIKGLLAGLRQR